MSVESTINKLAIQRRIRFLQNVIDTKLRGSIDGQGASRQLLTAIRNIADLADNESSDLASEVDDVAGRTISATTIADLADAIHDEWTTPEGGGDDTAIVSDLRATVSSGQVSTNGDIDFSQYPGDADQDEASQVVDWILDNIDGVTRQS